MKKPNVGETIGVIRSTDDLGRIVIPKEYRRQLKCSLNAEFEIFLLKDGIYLKLVK